VNWLRRLLHVHVYDVVEGPLDVLTLEPRRGAGPCTTRYRCRCGDEWFRDGWVTEG